MLSNQNSAIVFSALPDDFYRHLCSRIPDQNLGLVLVERRSLLNGSEFSLIDTWLTSDEQSQLDRYSFEKRRSEWLLGRICAKRATIDLLSRRNPERVNPQDISIEVGESGRPFLALRHISGLDEAPDISISHSHDKVVGLASNCHCGIDIQLVTDTLYKVRDRFCSQAELGLLDSTSEEELVQLGLLWVAKEAIRKCLGRSRQTGFLNMHLEEVRREQRVLLLEFQLDLPYGSIGSVSTVVRSEHRYCMGACTVARELGDA